MNTLNRAKQLQNRTKKFAVRVIKAFARLPKDEAIENFSASLGTAKANR